MQKVGYVEALKPLFGDMLVRRLRGAREFLAWRSRNYAAPYPNSVKRRTIQRNAIAEGIFVETGTYLGDTTAFSRRFSARVISIEPDVPLYRRAAKRFAGDPGIELINATSEAAFPDLLAALSGSITFWLDGHYSGGITHQGPTTTPIAFELKIIAANLDRFSNCVVMVDDLRCFGNDDGYPTPAYLSQWATEHGFRWSAEHDIMIMRR